ncbi:unnamed protein product [Rhizoctonia solani]|uniref:Uncharacterized protein n=1 Tax=Rhizoctonia solani TaxID=456999 RepID=A0A8H3E4U5_9AGAM|nr:unnamed protein product [Rhizoctonia solani]
MRRWVGLGLRGIAETEPDMDSQPLGVYRHFILSQSMIVVGMNALVRRSCTRIPVRAFATTSKPEGSGNKNRNQNKNRNGGKPRSQAGTRPAQEPKSGPAFEAKPAHVQKSRPASEFKANNHVFKAKSAPRPKQEHAPKQEPAPKPTPTPEPSASLETPDTHIPLPSPDPPLSSYALSPPQLRALIDLYHSSTSFITPETLSDAIDATFAPLRYHYNNAVRYQSYRDLIAQRDELDAEPDRVVPSANELGGRGFGTVDTMAGELIEGAWSASKGERARMVKAALWGVDPKAKIGLETLLEAKVELDMQDKDKE